MLAARHIEVDYADLYQATAPQMPDIAAYDALIFLGGPMSVNDDLPFLRQRNGVDPPGRWRGASPSSASVWERS